VKPYLNGGDGIYRRLARDAGVDVDTMKRVYGAPTDKAPQAAAKSPLEVLAFVGSLVTARASKLPPCEPTEGDLIGARYGQIVDAIRPVLARFQTEVPGTNVPGILVAGEGVPGLFIVCPSGQLAELDDGGSLRAISVASACDRYPEFIDTLVGTLTTAFEHWLAFNPVTEI
jgi:hypothetical protein